MTDKAVINQINLINSEDKMNIDPELKERIDQTIKGIAKIFANDIVSGKKSLEEMINDIDNSEIPDAAKKLIAFHMGRDTPYHISDKK